MKTKDVKTYPYEFTDDYKAKYDELVEKHKIVYTIEYKPDEESIPVFGFFIKPDFKTLQKFLLIVEKDAFSADKVLWDGCLIAGDDIFFKVETDVDVFLTCRQHLGQFVNYGITTLKKN